MEELKISKNLLKTISVDTRVQILKLLEKRQMTASEISQALNKHVTTISEHLDILKNSNLVERVERPGRKWIYYRLTKDADKILRPKVYHRWVLVLSISFLVIVGSIGAIFAFSYFSVLSTLDELGQVNLMADNLDTELSVLLSELVIEPGQEIPSP